MLNLTVADVGLHSSQERKLKENVLIKMHLMPFRKKCKLTAVSLNCHGRMHRRSAGRCCDLTAAAGKVSTPGLLLQHSHSACQRFHVASRTHTHLC